MIVVAKTRRHGGGSVVTYPKGSAGEAVNVDTGEVTHPGEPLPDAGPEDRSAGFGGYDRLTVDELRRELADRELSTDGRKRELVDRLLAHDAGGAVERPDGE